MTRSPTLFNTTSGIYIVFLGYLFVFIGIIFINPSSFFNFLYYFFFWFLVFCFINIKALDEFVFSFAVNSILIIVFYFIQIHYYPESFGTTSPLGSWTDDSYFFALVADSIPPELQVRDHYEEYTHPFASIIKFISLFSINNPLDVIFFQSGVVALLATYSKKFMFQISDDRKISEILFYVVLFCPFFAMHGGVVLIRDTFVSALLIFSLCCINERKFLLATSSILLSLYVRPGTMMILMVVYGIYYFPEIKRFLISFKGKLLSFVFAFAMYIAFFAIFSNELLFEALLSRIKANDISFSGREMYEDISKNSDSIFVVIQQSFLLIKLISGGLYFFVYPFFSYKEFFSYEYFDLRAFLLTIVMPIYSIGLNAFFVAALLTKNSEFKKIILLVLSVMVVYILLGTYSLQTRHKTIVQAIFYIIVVFGMFKSTFQSKIIGFIFSIIIFSLQLTIAIIK